MDEEKTWCCLIHRIFIIIIIIIKKKKKTLKIKIKLGFCTVVSCCKGVFMALLMNFSWYQTHRNQRNKTIKMTLKKNKKKTEYPVNMPRIYSQDFMSFIFTGFHRFSIHNAPRSVSNGEIARRAMHEIKKK